MGIPCASKERKMNRQLNQLQRAMFCHAHKEVNRHRSTRSQYSQRNNNGLFKTPRRAGRAPASRRRERQTRQKSKLARAFGRPRRATLFFRLTVGRTISFFTRILAGRSGAARDKPGWGYATTGLLNREGVMKGGGNHSLSLNLKRDRFSRFL